MYRMISKRHLEILKIFNGSLDESILRHIQMGIDLHGGSDAGVAD